MLTVVFNAVLELDAATGEAADVTFTGPFPSKVAVSPDERFLAYLGSGQNALFVEDRDKAVSEQLTMVASPIDVEIVGRVVEGRVRVRARGDRVRHGAERRRLEGRTGDVALDEVVLAKVIRGSSQPPLPSARSS
jgi:hypothetical protein